MDTAYTWADPRVIDVIKTKFDTLPQAGDKKGKGGKKGGGRPKTAPGSGKSKVRGNYPRRFLLDAVSVLISLFYGFIVVRILK